MIEELKQHQRVAVEPLAGRQARTEEKERGASGGRSRDEAEGAGSTVGSAAAGIR